MTVGATLQPWEVERWLHGLGGLVPREALQVLTAEVAKKGIDGVGFDALVASRSMLPMGDVVKPSHMAMLRRCWNNDFGGLRGLRVAHPRSSQAGQPFSTEAPSRLPEPPLPPPHAPPSEEEEEEVPARGHGDGRGRRPMALQREDDADEQLGAPGGRLRFAPPLRVNYPPAEPADASPGADGDYDDATGTDLEDTQFAPSRSHSMTLPIQARRPPQVPRLDLSGMHQNRGESGEALRGHQWQKQEPEPAQPLHAPRGRPEGSESAALPGFATASPEDQHRIAEFYGYRDEGFVATMRGLQTDQIRPRLYVGTMADAAYQPLLKALNITNIINCAVEAQHVPPPYASEGISYYQVPLQDSLDQTDLLIRQRFKTLRAAARAVHLALKAKHPDGGVLLHCVQGLSRSATVACAYLMEYEGVPVERAIAEVRAKHPGCLASQHWQVVLRKLNNELMRCV